MHLLFMRANNLDLPIDLQLKLFDNTVLPILIYSSEIHGYGNLDIIERVHTEFLRKITKSRKSTPNYTPTAIMLARYVTHMNTQSPGGICYASLEVGWYSIYQPTSNKA